MDPAIARHITPATRYTSSQYVHDRALDSAGAPGSLAARSLYAVRFGALGEHRLGVIAPGVLVRRGAAMPSFDSDMDYFVLTLKDGSVRSRCHLQHRRLVSSRLVGSGV